MKTNENWPEIVDTLRPYTNGSPAKGRRLKDIENCLRFLGWRKTNGTMSACTTPEENSGEPVIVLSKRDGRAGLQRFPVMTESPDSMAYTAGLYMGENIRLYNTFKSIIRDLSLDYPDFLIASSEWFAFVPAKEYFDEPGDHADELETSVMMHYHPELVNLDEAGNGDYKKFTSQMLNEKVAWIPRNWQKVSQDTGIGNPKKASAGKGKKYAEAVVAKYALLFEELVHKELY